ncbi:MAG TPA: methyltransferase domain-containing protein [Solirubrobacteraceae bacterium]|nr:methyltransferase domain-containing protein [Solirubrobacteraceae bacterium]
MARRHARRRVRRTVHAVRPATAVRAYLAAQAHSQGVAKLNVGAGGALLDGWLNTDRDPAPGAVYLDVTRRFPLPDAVFHRALVEHVIEHVTLEAGRHTLRECARVLAPGGRIRVSTPDLQRMAALVTDGGDPAAQRYVTWAAGAFCGDQRGDPAALVVNNAFRNWGHAFLYDEATLRTALTDAGFVDVVRRPYAQTGDEHLAGAEGAGIDDHGRSMRAFESVALEARRA